MKYLYPEWSKDFLSKTSERCSKNGNGGKWQYKNTAMIGCKLCARCSKTQRTAHTMKRSATAARDKSGRRPQRESPESKRASMVSLFKMNTEAPAKPKMAEPVCLLSFFRKRATALHSWMLQLWGRSPPLRGMDRLRKSRGRPRAFSCECMEYVYTCTTLSDLTQDHAHNILLSTAHT